MLMAAAYCCRGGVAPWRVLRRRGLCSAEPPRSRPKRIYVIAGEASGDGIGAKVLTALQRKAIGDSTSPSYQSPTTGLCVRGIGGPRMEAAGGFRSLFPMRDLSVMGLVEVVPSLWRLRRRLAETLDDIRAFQPDLVLTIDSKGFSFRVLRALADDPRTRDSIRRMHYVAPSVWAYKHRQRQANHDGLAALVDKMFVILPFEAELFHAKTTIKSKWCEFVGHPAVEDFLEHAQCFYDNDDNVDADEIVARSDELPNSKTPLLITPGGLLETGRLDDKDLEDRGMFFHRLMRTGRGRNRQTCRGMRGYPQDAFVLCALVGSRENEVRQTLRMVLAAIADLQQLRPTATKASVFGGIPIREVSLGSGCRPRRPMRIVFPTIASLESLVRNEIRTFRDEHPGFLSTDLDVVVDMDPSARIDLFHAADAAVAVSGTIVMETTLAALPTIVIYRANCLTEFLAKKLAAVQFVSIPNLLLGRPVIPELLFRECTTEKITEALRPLYTSHHTVQDDDHRETQQLALALSTLTVWTQARNGTQRNRPVRASDLVAESIWKCLYPKNSSSSSERFAIFDT